MKYTLLVAFLLISGIVSAQSDTTLYGYVDSVKFRQAELYPAFPGGPNAWQYYLKKHLKYPKEAKKKGIEGTVIVEFTVESNAHLSDIKIYKSVDPSLDGEALRLFQNILWVPALQNGRQVRYRTRESIPFKLQDQ